MTDEISINRAPVLTLWTAVVAERLGFDWNEALTLGRAVAGLNAYSKGVSLGLYEPSLEAHRKRKRTLHGEVILVDLLHRAVPAVRTPDGLRALSQDRPITPRSVQRYLETKFGDRFADARAAMTRLARTIPPRDLTRRAYALYEAFRPQIPPGLKGWGAAGALDLDMLAALAERRRAS